MNFLQYSDFNEPANLIFYDPLFHCSETEYLLCHGAMYQRQNVSNGIVFSLEAMSFV